MLYVINSTRMACLSYSAGLKLCYPHPRQYRIISRTFQMNFLKRKPNVAVINLHGAIASRGGLMTGKSPLNLENLEKHIEKAFAMKQLQEVCLLINSPGGSPAQSDLIANKILHLSKKKNIKVVSFAEDMAASGGYYLACAGSEIYATNNSIVGSIGVIGMIPGLHKLLKRFDIETRIYRMGSNKGVDNMFEPETPESKAIRERNMKIVYKNFIDYVKEQRGDRLKAEDEVLFTGEYWIGQDALDLGLIDGIKTLNDYVYEKYGDDVNVVRVNKKKEGFLAGLYNNSNISISDIADSLVHSPFKIMLK